MGSKPVPAVLSSAAFPRLGPHGDLLGLVQLLRSSSDRVAIFWLWSAADIGAVSLSWNRASYRLMADVIASRSWISDVRIPRGNRLWRHWRGGPVVRRAKVISSSRHANGIVHLPGRSRFHGPVFPGDHGIRRNLQSLDGGFGS